MRKEGNKTEMKEKMYSYMNREREVFLRREMKYPGKKEKIFIETKRKKNGEETQHITTSKKTLREKNIHYH